jgi:hypothetical protein
MVLPLVLGSTATPTAVVEVPRIAGVASDPDILTP